MFKKLKENKGLLLGAGGVLLGLVASLLNDKANESKMREAVSEEVAKRLEESNENPEVIDVEFEEVGDQE